MSKSTTAKTNGHAVAELKPAAPAKSARGAANSGAAKNTATATSARAPARKAAVKAAPAKGAGTRAGASGSAASKPSASKPAAAKSAATKAVTKAAVTKAAVTKSAAPKAASKPVARKAVAVKAAPKKAAARATPARDDGAPAAAPKKREAAKPARATAVTGAASGDQIEVTRERTRKAKLVRDSFTMPEQEYAVLGQVKKACLKAGLEIKKSELLRIGVALISQLDMATLQKILGDLPQLKTGRPKIE